MNAGFHYANGEKKMSKKPLIIGLIVGLFLIAFSAVGLWIHSESQKETYDDFHKEFAAYGLYSRLTDPGDALTVCFDGEKSNFDNFRGTLAIKKGQELIVEYKDCRIEKHEDGYYYVKKHLDWTEDMDVPKPNDTVFCMTADENWDKVLLIPMWEEFEKYVAIVAPATDHDAAYALFEELY